jgi:hypothetical protein
LDERDTEKRHQAHSMSGMFERSLKGKDKIKETSDNNWKMKITLKTC